MRLTSLLSLAAWSAGAAAIAISDFESCPIPYIVPRAFRWVCDPIDEYITERMLPTTVPKGYKGTHPQFFANKYMKTIPDLWTHEPWCLFSTEAGSELCVYTSHTYGYGRGISIVVQPSEVPALILAHAIRFQHTYKFPSMPASSVNPDLWADERMEQRWVPGKGRGMVAREILRRGDVVQAYTPVLSVQDLVMQIRQGSYDLLMPIKVAVQRMTNHSRWLFEDQWGHFGGDPYYDRVNTNAFNSVIGQSPVYFWSLYPESARYNHDCRPNTMYSIDNDDMLHNLKVGRQIIPGEEISLSYLAPNMQYEERASRTRAQWGFNCSCSLCHSPSWVHDASDDRVALIDELELELNDLSEGRNASTSTAELLVSLHKQERLDGVIGDAYMYAAFEYAYIGDKRKVQQYAALAVEHMIVWRGSYHQYFQAMLRLMTNPEKEKSWKYFEKVKKGEIEPFG